MPDHMPDQSSLTPLIGFMIVQLYVERALWYKALPQKRGHAVAAWSLSRTHIVT